MKKKSHITRRQAIAALSSATGLLLTGCKTNDLPLTYGDILRMGDLFTYVAQRKLLPGQIMAKEYGPEDISSFPSTSISPADAGYPKSYNEEYCRHAANNFKDWSVAVSGSVNKPQSFTLEKLRAYESRTQVTRHQCEEGWSAIGGWTGVPLGVILQEVDIKPSARFVNFIAYDGFTGSIDLYDAYHPQTLLAYGMNGSDLPEAHGAPLRARVETQIGYKSVKYLQRIELVDDFPERENTGWSWFAGI